MRLFRSTYKDGSGKRRKLPKWYIEFKDHLDRTKRLPAYTDKEQSETLGRNVMKLVAMVGNHETPDVMTNRWLEALSPQIRTRLVAIGLIEGRAMAATKALAEHLCDFKAALDAKANTAKHARQTEQRARKLFDACGFKVWSDIQAAAVESQLAQWRNGIARVAGAPSGRGGKPGLSIQTSNEYLAAAKQFCRWMVMGRRATQSPLEHLKKLNAATDRRHDRRALSIDELRRLLTAAEAGADLFGVSGRERTLIYRLAVESGLRSNELRSLTRSSFAFGKRVATVTVEACSSKRRRRDELPLRADTAELLRAHVAGKHPGAAAFNLPQYEYRRNSMAGMIRADLAAARSAWLDESSALEER